MSTKTLVKPYPQFPLTPHARGYWVKVINGKQHRFGTRWCEPDEALEEYYTRRAAIEAAGEEGGLPVLPTGPSVTLREGMLAFLVSRKERLDRGEISQRTYKDYYDECIHMRDVVGAETRLCTIGPTHFNRLRASYTGTPGSVANRIGRIKVMCKYLHTSGVINTPMQFGDEFRKPSAKAVRLHRASQPKKLFTPEQIHGLVNAAKPQMRAMIYLGLFAGFGNTDVALVSQEHFDGDWVTYPRSKTGIERRAWLSPEAVAAVKALEWPLKTKYGNPWLGGVKCNPVSAEFHKVAKVLGVNLGFYALRHTCQTIGDRAKDPVATSYIMGHVTAGMGATYRETVEDDRLRAVGEAIQKWLDIDVGV